MLKEQEHAGTLMLMAGEHKNKQSSTVPARRAPTALRPKKKKKADNYISLLKYSLQNYLSFSSDLAALWCNDS